MRRLGSARAFFLGEFGDIWFSYARLGVKKRELLILMMIL